VPACNDQTIFGVWYDGPTMSNPAQHPTQWRKQWAGKVCTPDDLVRFVDAMGCCAWSALAAYPDFPNQSDVMGDVPAGTSDTWFWKDDLHIEKRLYYTRVFGGHPGYISNALLPVFVATNGAVFDELVFNGLLTAEAQQIYKLIEASGPIPIKELKGALTPDAKRSASRILIDLDREFLITKTGITGRTRGTYGYIWDLTERWIPDTLQAADRLGRKQGAANLRNHLSAQGIPPDSPFYARVLGWGPDFG